MSEELSIEQLRGVLQARFSELDAYRYMDQVLAKVEAAQQDVTNAKNELADFNKDIADKEAALGALEREYADREAAMVDRLTTQERAIQVRIASAQDDLGRKQHALATWQDNLTKIEAEHKKTLATWQDRIQQARAEHEQIQARLTTAQQQFDALAAMIGKR